MSHRPAPSTTSPRLPDSSSSTTTTPDARTFRRNLTHDHHKIKSTTHLCIAIRRDRRPSAGRAAPSAFEINTAPLLLISKRGARC